MDRTIHFGDDAADARYRIQDTSSTGGDLVLAEDLDGGTVLLEYDYSASEWVSRGPVNLSGNDITNAGSITADTLEATSGTVDGKDIPGVGTSTGGDTSFGDWEQPSTDRPVRLSLQAEVQTDGNDNGRVVIEIDESGQQMPDTFQLVADADSSLPAGTTVNDGRSFLLPAGAQFRVVNTSDPNGVNSFAVERIFTL